MKRFLALLLALVMVLSFAACSKNEPTGSTPTEPTRDLSKLDKLYWRESYTASDADAAAARNSTVASVGGAELTNGMLQIYYWMEVYSFLNDYGNYLGLYGLNPTKPLDSQACVNTDGTWQHNFLKGALDNWYCYQSLALAAEKTNTPMDPELQKELDGLYDSLKKRAEDGKFDSIDALIQSESGPGCTAEDYYNYTAMCYRGFSYFNKMVDEINVTDTMIEDYFKRTEADLKKEGISKESGNVCSVRHILIEVAEGKSDADWETCRDKAQKLLDEWLTGEHTENTFADFAKKHSTDGGSSSNGGLYEGLNSKTNFVPEFKEWYLAEGRKAGDYGLVKTSYGYHIMYFSSTEPEWIYRCREAVTSELSSRIISNALKEYQLNVNYDKILLGEVSLSNS